jgi:aminoglycoside 6'-N-acetyltransferase I
MNLKVVYIRKTMMELFITDLQQSNDDYVNQTAHLLYAAFIRDYPDAWPTLDAALQEVTDSLADDLISRIAVTDNNLVVGWVGGIPQYDGHVWELHPLAVLPAYQNKHIGARLVNDFESQVRQRGGLTIFLGTDDETGQTSLFGMDLYPGVLSKAQRIQNLGRHPFGFYQKMGFEVVGIVPDANGYGKPDILMAKRVLTVNNSQG